MNSQADFDLRSPFPNLRDAIRWHGRSGLARRWGRLTVREKMFAVSRAVNDRLTDEAIRTLKAVEEKDAKRAYYLSMEFLIGKSLEDNLINQKLAMRLLGDIGYQAVLVNNGL